MRRLNVKLALWLVGITVFSVVGVHLLHGYQVDRNASFLKVQAERARDAGNAEEAISQYNQYLRHRDDRDGYKELAELVVEVAKEPDASRRQQFRAYNILEEAIRRHPDLDEVRSSLVDYTMMMGRFADAQDHIRILHDNGSDDPALEYKSAICYFRNLDEDLAREKLCAMVGFDDVADVFVEEPPATAKEIRAFALLAQILRNSGEDQLADTVMQQLVTWNPDSPDAHLMRGQYLLGVRETVRSDDLNSQKIQEQLLAEGKAEFEKAYQQAPDNADALLALSNTAIMEKDFDKAQQLLERARQEHPDRQAVYVRLATLALQRGNNDQADEQLQLGLENAADTRQILERLIDIQFQKNDLEAVRATCERMRALDTIPPEYVRFQEARLKLAEGKIVEATRELEKVRPAMERLGGRQTQSVNSFLGKCYQLLGLPDQELEVYRRLLSSYPNMILARVGEAGALQNLGRYDEAETSISLLVQAAEEFPVARRPVLRLAVNQQLSKPEEERDWQAADKVAALLFQDESRSAMTSQMLMADLYIAQGRDDEALRILTAARKQNPKEISVWVALARLLARDESRRGNIPQLLELAEQQVGDTVALRNERIRSIVSAPGETAKEELKQMEQGLDKFNDRQQRALMQQLGRAYLRIGEYDEAKRCWDIAIAKDPTNGRIRQLLFELAMERKDEGAMQSILDEIRKSSHFGPQSALFKYCDASRTLQNLDVRQPDRDTLTERDRAKLLDVRKQIEEAQAVRKEWAPLWRVLGDIDQLEGNTPGAISNYQRSLDLSRFNQEATARRLVALLYSTGRFSEANEALKYLSAGNAPDQLRYLIRDIKRRSGDTAAALAMAKKDVEADPDNPANHISYGQLLNTVGRADEAEQAFRKATQVAPELPAAWEALVQRLLASREKLEAVKSVREASQKLSGDLLAMARLYQLVGDQTQAEALYKKALEDSPNDLTVLRRIAEFTSSGAQPLRANEYLDRMIEVGRKASDNAAGGQVRWARRKKAQNLADVGDYQNLMAAVELIEQNMAEQEKESGQPARADMVSIVSALGDRSEPASRAKAIKYLEQLHAIPPGLTALQMTALGKLYDRAGQWAKARSMMEAAINRSSEDPTIFGVYAGMLLAHDEIEEARRFADKADELMAGASGRVAEAAKPEIRLVRARLLIQDGQKEQAAALLEGLLTRPLPQNQLFRLGVLAKEFERLGLYEDAERLLNEYMSQEPRGAIAMGAFKGRRGEVAEAFELLEEARTSQPVIEIVPVALEILRYYPDEATPERCQKLEQWSTDALQTEVNPQRIKLILAELYDLQGRYDDVSKIYREMLADPNVTPEVRASVQNNLAFLLAAVNPTPKRGAEALEMVEDAIRVLGPRGDLLDTRAVAYLAQGKAQQAASDIRVAVTDAPSIAKYYHLAQVEKQLGNLDAAREALSKAEALTNDDHMPFTPAERKGFESLKQELN